MIRALRGLMVDDEHPNAEIFVELLDAAFEELSLRTSWTLIGGSVEARKAIKREPPFDFAIVDLYLAAEDGDGPRPIKALGGMPVVRTLREQSNETYIFMVTGYPDRDRDYWKDVRNYVNAAVDRREIDDDEEWPFLRVATCIRDHLVSKGVVELGRTAFDSSDVGIVSVLHRIGSDAADDRRAAGARVLRELALQCLADRVSVSCDLVVNYVVPGFSGNHMCRIDVSEDGIPRSSYMLKFGFDRVSLQRELHANKELSNILSQGAMAVQEGGLAKHPSGYAAICARAENAVSLRDWLVRTESSDDAVRAARTILGDYLAPLFGRHFRLFVSTGEWLKLSALQRLRVTRAIDRYGDVLASRDAADVEDAAEVRDRLNVCVTDYGQLACLAERPPAEVIFVKTFGDLHADNILIVETAHPRPVLIDASAYRDGHWASDSARLMVDLLLRNKLHSTESMVWSSFDRSLRQAQNLCSRCGGTADLGAVGLNAFVRECVSNIVQFCRTREMDLIKEGWHWQWHMALSREFLRQAPHEDLTPVRVALALVASDLHLRKADELLRALEYE